MLRGAGDLGRDALAVRRLAAALAVFVLNAGAAWAQTAETAHALAAGTDTLVQYGIGGVFLLFLIGLGWFLWSALQTAQSDNRALTREAIAGLNTSAAAIKDLTATGSKASMTALRTVTLLVDSLPDQASRGRRYRQKKHRSPGEQ